MNIGKYTYEEFLEKAAAFHGNPAPGLILGGYMVELAKKHIPEDTLFDAIVETPKCLPDAVQLLTLCSYGNGWMKIVNLGRYALTLYDKYTGQGVRVFLDPDRLEMWPETKAWYLKLKPKAEQDKKALLEEIRRAGASGCGVRRVQVAERHLKKKDMGRIVVCPVCREAYPAADGGICRGCQGEAPYFQQEQEHVLAEGPDLKAVPVEQAVGKQALHDMTQIEPEKSKGPAFIAGQEITAGDVCRLQTMGKERVYVHEDNEPDEAWIHENEAALSFGKAMAGESIYFDDPPKEGKINFYAEKDGLFVVDTEMLERFNLVPHVMCATRHSWTIIEKGKAVAGCRAIPLYLSKQYYQSALATLDAGPLLKVLPLLSADVAVLVTGTEVFQGLIEDKFLPIIKSKVEHLGCRVVASEIVPDDREVISEAIDNLLQAQPGLIITTAGLSVDPDDVTRAGLVDAGLEDALYGMPVLPGAMLMLGRIGNVRVMGVPACALYFKTTSFDLMLPPILAGLPVSRRDLARMAEGGFCLSCKSCTFPKCPFGK